MAKIISGKEVSSQIQAKLRDEVAKLSIKPCLAIVQVGARDDSNVYIRMKVKFSEEVGVAAIHHKLPKSTTETQVRKNINTIFNIRPKLIILIHS